VKVFLHFREFRNLVTKVPEHSACVVAGHVTYRLSVLASRPGGWISLAAWRCGANHRPVQVSFASTPAAQRGAAVRHGQADPRENGPGAARGPARPVGARGVLEPLRSAPLCSVVSVCLDAAGV